jgi:hypothetical protein
MTKIKVKSILITSQGGPIESYYNVVLGNWLESDTILRLWARTAPKNGCCDTCNFQILFEDGNSYSGIYRLRQQDTFLKSLLPHHICKTCKETGIGWDADEFLFKYDIPMVA